jgi:hypothetical protein
VLSPSALKVGFDAIWRTAEDALGEATRRAPIELGDLRASGALTPIVNGRRIEGEGSKAQAEALITALVRAGRVVDMRVEVSFNTIYAARQHEELEWKHPKGGQAKYLESVISERAGRYKTAVDLAVDVAIAKASAE